MVDVEKFCFNCFHEKADSGVCPHCGYDNEDNTVKFPNAIKAGSILDGQYIVGRVLGQGGFGITYLALDYQLELKVAIKEYLPDGMAARLPGTSLVSAYEGEKQENFNYGAERFLEEAKVLAKFVNHKNIVSVKRYFRENNTAYFVMDYIEGINFKTYIKNHGGKVDYRDALRILLPVMDALSLVHREGVIHRDVTPDNIFITKDDEIKLLDFGSARYSLGDKSKCLDVILKAGYAPKEQYIRKGRQAPYTDVYSLAACFYASITGYLPPEALERMEEDELIPISTRGIHIPDELENAILKGLEVRAEDRFQSMEEFKAAIMPGSGFAGEPIKTPEEWQSRDNISGSEMQTSSGILAGTGQNSTYSQAGAHINANTQAGPEVHINANTQSGPGVQENASTQTGPGAQTGAGSSENKQQLSCAATSPSPSWKDKIKKWNKKTKLGAAAAVLLLLITVSGLLAYTVKAQNTRSEFRQTFANLEESLGQKDLGPYAGEYDELHKRSQEAIDGKDTKEMDQLTKEIGSFEARVEEEKEAISEMSASLGRIQDRFQEYLLDEGDYQNQYDDGVTAWKEALNKFDVKEARKQEQNLTELEQAVTDENLARLTGQMSQLESGDTSKAYDYELEQISELKEGAGDLIGYKKFVSAGKKLEKWQELLTAMNTESNNLDIQVMQVDTSEYPKLKLYLDIKNTDTGETPDNLEKGFFYLSEKLSQNEDYVKQSIIKAAQLNEQESLNINMVADVSASMEGYPLEDAKAVMKNFLDNVQFGIGDKVELTAFSTGVYTRKAFTTDKSSLSGEVDALITDDMTSLYDALYAAVNRTATQSGAKCVIAFTDGEDNNSYCTPEDVIEAANHYRIPVFIIGVGSSLNTYDLERIGAGTNGFYRNISDISSMADIYDAIYRQQKELYLLEYEVPDSENTINERQIRVSYQNRILGGECQTSYSPVVLMSVNSSVSGISQVEQVMHDYLNGYIYAINNHDFSYIAPCIVTDSPLYQEVKPYIMKDIKESLLSYEVLNTEFQGDDTCIITIKDTYEILNGMEPLHMRVFKSKYVLKKQSDGSWKLYAFADKIKLLSKIKS